MVYKFRNWDPVSKHRCWFDVSYSKATTANAQRDDEDNQYVVRLKPSDTITDRCMDIGSFIEIETRTATVEDMQPVMTNVKRFGLFGVLIMIALVFVYEKEAGKFEEIFQRRFLSPETHGQEEHSYAYEFSFYTNIVLFVVNFGIFMVYFQLCLAGLTGITFAFTVAIFLQFMILFFFSNKHFTFHLRIIAMDRYRTEDDQVGYLSLTQLKVYVLSFLLIIFISKIYFTNFLIFLVFGNIWIP